MCLLGQCCACTHPSPAFSRQCAAPGRVIDAFDAHACNRQPGRQPASQPASQRRAKHCGAGAPQPIRSGLPPVCSRITLTSRTGAAMRAKLGTSPRVSPLGALAGLWCSCAKPPSHHGSLTQRRRPALSPATAGIEAPAGLLLPNAPRPAGPCCCSGLEGQFAGRVRVWQVRQL